MLKWGVCACRYIYIIYAFFNNAEVTGDSKVNIGKKDEGE